MPGVPVGRTVGALVGEAAVGAAVPPQETMAIAAISRTTPMIKLVFVFMFTSPFFGLLSLSYGVQVKKEVNTEKKMVTVDCYLLFPCFYLFVYLRGVW